MKRTLFLLIVMTMVCAFAQQSHFNPWSGLDIGTKNITIFAKNTVQMKGQSPIEMDIKAYMTKDYVRFETTQSSKETTMGMDTTVVSDMKKKTSYFIVDAKKSYVEMDIKDTDPATSSDYTEEKKFISNEKVGKYDCKKYEVTSWMKSSPKNTKQTRAVWEDVKSGIPVKVIATEKDMTMTYIVTDIKEGRISADLFKVPAGYKKADSVMSLYMEGMMVPDSDDKDAPPSNMMDEMNKYKKMFGN